MYMLEIVAAFLVGIATTVAFLHCLRPTLLVPASRHDIVVSSWARFTVAAQRRANKKKLWSWLGKLLSANRTELITIAPARLNELRKRWSALGRSLRGV